MLVIPRLPFQYPDALQEKKREAYPDLRSFIRAVAVPEMQIKLKQGFGRAIRMESDTCVIAILDERSAKQPLLQGHLHGFTPNAYDQQHL